MDINSIKELLKDQNNTRNFSHIRTVCGKSIRPDIMRSNILSSKSQTADLISDDIKTIIDLRIAQEGGGSSNSSYANSNINHLPIAFGNLDFERIKELLALGEMEQIDTFMKNGYRSFTTDFKDEVKTFFNLLLANDNLPIVFHCTAGKDRTGMLTALFLLALKVPKDDVITDYLETNNRLNAKDISKQIGTYLSSNSSVNLENSEKSIKSLEMLFAVNKSWIDIFLEGTQENYGSIELYLENEIKVDVERLRKMYLIV